MAIYARPENGKNKIRKLKKMAYSLGIDAGGTYTDSILIRNSDGKVISSNKALTTYPDLLEGITKSIDGLDQEKLKLVTMVSVSTTLATNTILEKTGYPVADPCREL